MKTGLILKENRERMLLTQKEIAELLSVTVTHISNIEVGRSDLPPYSVPVLSELFGLDRQKIYEDLADQMRMAFLDRVNKKKLSRKEQADVRNLKKLSDERKEKLTGVM